MYLKIIFIFTIFLFANMLNVLTKFCFKKFVDKIVFLIILVCYYLIKLKEVYFAACVYRLWVFLKTAIWF